MKRILCIDYGSKNCGVAVSDVLQIIANPLPTVLSQELFPFLKKYTSENEVEKILIGIPKNLKNEDTDATQLATNAYQALKNKFPHIEIISLDERFTSKIASRTILEMGVNKKKRSDKKLVDQISATYLLQEYLSQKSI